MIIRRLDSRAIQAVRTQLATLLLDAVADGHSLGFLAGLDDVQLDAYWSGVEADVARAQPLELGVQRRREQRQFLEGREEAVADDGGRRRLEVDVAEQLGVEPALLRGHLVRARLGALGPR